MVGSPNLWVLHLHVQPCALWLRSEVSWTPGCGSHRYRGKTLGLEHPWTSLCMEGPATKPWGHLGTVLQPAWSSWGFHASTIAFSPYLPTSVFSPEPDLWDDSIAAPAKSQSSCIKLQVYWNCWMFTKDSANSHVCSWEKAWKNKWNLIQRSCSFYIFDFSKALVSSFP